MFLTNSGLGAGKMPHLQAPGFKGYSQHTRQSTAAQPVWLQQVDSLVKTQKRWMLYIHWELQQLQWQVQMAHMNKFQGKRGGPGEAGSLAQLAPGNINIL